MPCLMIRKVAIVQALREAFPEDLGGLYDIDEMDIDKSKLDMKDVVVVREEVDNNEKEQDNNEFIEQTD